MSKQRSSIIWVCEILGEALGTVLWMAAIAVIEAPPGARNDFSVRLISGMSAFVLIEFALTGYLLTTLISALYLFDSRRFLYPAVSSGLYLVHSSIFFVGVGNRILNKETYQFSLAEHSSRLQSLPLGIGNAAETVLP